MHAWRYRTDPAVSGARGGQLSPGRAGRVAMLSAASHALHEREGFRCRGEGSWLRRDVAAKLDLPAAAVEAEFADDHALTTATIAWLSRVHLRRQRTLAGLLATADFRRWTRAALVQCRTPGPLFGCELGWLAQQPDIAGVERDLLDNVYCIWQGQLATALRALQARGLLDLEADVQRLSAAVLSLLQGAYLTACRIRDFTPIEASFDAAARLVTNPPAW